MRAPGRAGAARAHISVQRPAWAAVIVKRVCGIVGYVGGRSAREVLLAGLSRLEYRGYDSAGISVLTPEGIESVRAVGNLSALRAKLADGPPEAYRGGSAVAVAERPPSTGIGHTRWATHGRVSEENAHPHCDSADRGPRSGQRHRRELRRAEGAPRRLRQRIQLRDRRRGHRPPDRRALRRTTWPRPCGPPTPSSRATSRSWR